MKLKELLTGVKVLELHADTELDITEVCYDSRKAVPGCLFVAVTGYESDGWRFIGSAVEKGAAAVICEKAPETDIPYVLTDNSRMALALISANYFGRPADRLRIVGITGTNGKTTSTTLVKAVIEKCLGAKVGLIGTNQNMIGDEVLETERTTPESFELHKLFAAMVEKGCTYCVMEVSSHSLFLDRVAGITFDVGAFTNLTQDHLDFHKTMDNYAAAKALLFNMCRTGVVNVDDKYADVMLAADNCAYIRTSAKDAEAELQAKNIRLGESKVSFCLLHGDSLDKIELGIPGEFSVYNALTVLGCSVALGIPVKDAAAALAQCSGVKGRAEVVPTGLNFTVLIDYAHTPDAIENILNTARGFTKGRLIILFGCGGDRDAKKRPIMGSLAAKLADYVIVTSDNPRTEDPDAIIADILAGMTDTETPYSVIPDRIEAIGYALENGREGDVIILAGKGHETYQIIGKVKHHMDEREIIADKLAAMRK